LAEEPSVSLLPRVAGRIHRLADALADREDAQKAKAIELTQQRTEVMLLRREARERQRERDRGVLPWRPEP
jgi:hypothetical protein